MVCGYVSGPCEMRLIVIDCIELDIWVDGRFVGGWEKRGLVRWVDE